MFYDSSSSASTTTESEMSGVTGGRGTGGDDDSTSTNSSAASGGGPVRHQAGSYIPISMSDLSDAAASMPQDQQGNCYQMYRG